MDVRKYGAPFEFTKDPGNDCWMLRPNGGHYDTRAGAIYYDHLNFCGCGNPEAARELIAKLLVGGKPWEPGGPARPCGVDEAAEIIKADPEAAAWTLLYMLDAWELTEHGGSVNGAWLTPRGKQAAEIFAAETIDLEDVPTPNP
jgi:hypothetical protein